MPQINLRIKLVVLNQLYFDTVNDKELLHSTHVNERANILILKLTYRNEKYNFALPWRSNVPNTPKLSAVIFPLPNTSKTIPGHKACLDFRKMAPLPKNNKLYHKYHLNLSNDYITVAFIEKNLPQIIKRAERYLHNREIEKIHVLGLVDLDGALRKLKAAGF